MRYLAQGHELVLLSDHAIEAIEWVTYIHDIHPFLALFNFQFFSFQLKQTKPKPSTFERVLATIRRRPEQCLFIDDSIGTIDSAAKIGMAGIRFTGAEALGMELTARGKPNPEAGRQPPMETLDRSRKGCICDSLN